MTEFIVFIKRSDLKHTRTHTNKCNGAFKVVVVVPSIAVFSHSKLQVTPSYPLDCRTTQEVQAPLHALCQLLPLFDDVVKITKKSLNVVQLKSSAAVL